MNRYTEPNLENAALLTIDMQRDFTLSGASAEVPGTNDVVSAVQHVTQQFREYESLPIIHVIRLYREDGSNVDLCRRSKIEQGQEIVRPGSDGAELIDELKLSPRVQVDADRLLSGAFQPIRSTEMLMYKPRWGAFYNTPLEAYLKDVGVNTVIICGCNFPNCPRTTVYEASERDFKVVLVTDAVSGVYERGLDELRDINTTLMSSAEIGALLSEANA